MSRTTDRALVFDVDGTLAVCADTHAAVANILTRHGASGSKRQLAKAISAANSDWALVQSCVPPQACDAAYEEILTVNAKSAQSSRCDPSISPALAALGSEYRLFVLSGRDTLSIGLVLEKHRLLGYFEALVGTGPGIAEKPDPRALLELLSRHGVEAERATYIGDKDVDWQLAQRSGVAFVGATWYGTRLSVDCVRITTPRDLPAGVAQTYRARSAVVLRTTSSHE